MALTLVYPYQCLVFGFQLDTETRVLENPFITKYPTILKQITCNVKRANVEFCKIRSSFNIQVVYNVPRNVGATIM